jgi:hypothetical protein
MTQYIQKLPAVFQTVTEKKFFDATFDQVFSKKDSDQLLGYLGRRTPGLYNPVTDFYVPEPSKDRTWWQLEATAFSRNADSTRSNIFFYDDLLNRINYYGGNTLNQDRLFESEYYSWAPPIDYDMFTNYQNYYWVPGGLSAIQITGMTDADIDAILGQYSFNTNQIPGALPANLQFTTGLTVQFVGSAKYPDKLIVEVIGGTTGIRLVPPWPGYTPGTLFEFLPWDGITNLATGRTIQNIFWDSQTWDVEPAPGNSDYITIERSSPDENAWSRTNSWYHIDVINETLKYTGLPFPSNASRALRPIIQFTADLILYKSGTTFKSDIEYGFRGDLQSNPLLLSAYNNIYTRNQLDLLFGIQLQQGQLAIFMQDVSVNNQLLQVNINPSTDIVTFDNVGSVAVEQDIVFATLDSPYNGLKRGQTYYYSAGQWVEAVNEKYKANQPPIFQLYDHNGVALDDPAVYPESSFAGSKIFSYQINSTPGATVDPVLKFPIVYTGLGQSTDIMFENNLVTDRYKFNPDGKDINGYYYYKSYGSELIYNAWNLYNSNSINTPSSINSVSKQRVIDKFVVGYGVEYQFALSVTPNDWSSYSPDIIVTVNDVEVKLGGEANPSGYSLALINNTPYVILQRYLTELMLTPQTVAPVVQVDSYISGYLDPNNLGLLNPAKPGYFEIPQQLEANPTQQEVTTISGSDLINQFTSIIANQDSITGRAFGGPNNYRDTFKNNTLGSFILQNVAPALKTMLISSGDDVDFITGVRFSQDEYTKFKNKYLKVAQQLINQEFSPVQYHNNTIVINAWVDEIIKVVNISKEFSNAFAYSYMIANGTPYLTETATVPAGGIVTLTNYIDITADTNALYIYDTTQNQRLLILGVDYIVTSTTNPISVEIINPDIIGDDIYIALYKNPLPAYIPSTPTKVGAYNASVPRIELDESYSIPTFVIIGHDGSKTITYGDYRDQLLLELEIRIYNLLQARFREEYKLPLRLENVKPGYYRATRYSRKEYLNITESYLNKWSAKNRANYRHNDWNTASADLIAAYPTTWQDRIWMLYNYSLAVATVGGEGGQHLNLPGNWKGIFQYYYDTIYPNTRPWEMLGFSAMPSWWISEYGAPMLNSSGELAWAVDYGNAQYMQMWTDLSEGIIRHGPSAIFDPITNIAQPQPMWARSGLLDYSPVDSMGNIIPVPQIFNITMSGNPDAPFEGYNYDWVYGDGAPVEQAWMSTSGYAFSVQEFLYLMNPGKFGELLFDTVGTDISAGKIYPSDPYSPISDFNWQYVQNDTYTSSDPLFAWMRPKNSTQIVHAETVDTVVQIRFGYQRWISDRILFLGKDVGTTFGQKVRTLDVNLANKLAGFTNKDTTTTYIEGVSTSATTNSLLIPTNNFEVALHKGQPIRTYSYSGVIIRALDNGTFAVYGYDLLNSVFTVLNRSNAQMMDITVGGTPADYKTYTKGETYNAGDIIRYNGIYYMSIGTIVAGKFNTSNWEKLKVLPVTGGVSVVYKPISEVTSYTVPYGSILTSAQAVFDLLIGWGAYLETQGWQFTEVSSDTNQISDWLYCAKQFLFWLNSSWAPDASIQLSPAANKAILTVKGGYPDDIEAISNGVYSILDKYGVAMPPTSTFVDRTGLNVTVSPADLSSGGIYFVQVHTSETEHVLIFDNTTSFNDVVYNPLLRARQQRIRFNGFRSNGWYGKQEAPGYLVIGNQLVPNYDTIVDAMRYYYDPDVTIDNHSLEDLGRHLIGYESKSYLDNLQVSNDVQYLFYQGAIRQKGTVQAFDKLFRSTKVQGNEIIELYEEWALKLADFGNTIEQVSTEFILKPEQNTGEVIVARMNFIPSHIGFVKEINILNTQNKYTTVPKVVISLPDADPTDPNLTQALRPAKAYAVLDSNGVIARIDMTDGGYGYLSAPGVILNAGSQICNLDEFYAVWQGEIKQDATLDNIVDIDIDDTEKWIVRPANPTYSLEFPTTNVIDYSIPNAGYVNYKDVNWTTFNATQATAAWGLPALNPKANETVWVANTFTQDWCVYKLHSDTTSWQVTQDASGNLSLLILISAGKFVPQGSSVIGIQTDFGNLITLQLNSTSVLVPSENHLVGVTAAPGASPTDPWGQPADDAHLDEFGVLVPATHYVYSLVDLAGTPITANELGSYAELTDMLLFKTMRFLTTPAIPSYVTSGDKVWVDNVNNLWTVFKYTTSLTPYRVQEQLINTHLFENAQVFNAKTQTELVLLPVYDPFKDILPAPAKQNLTYMLEQDPARYNVTGNTRLFTENITFGNAQVGKLWWDLSTVRYAYYEQPKAIDETVTENLVYRRDRWGQAFTGSLFNIYEWTKSPVPPAQYTGTGIPKDVTTYVQIATSNRFTNITEINYYFWVLNPTTKPNIENRTLAALDVSRLLANPKSLGFAFFNPIQQTAINNSYIFYNVQEILAYQGDNVQIQYRVAERNDQKHTQWKFFREGDRNSIVTNQYWDKMVDSLAGYTKLLPVSSEWNNSNGFVIGKDLPWDIYGWDVSPYDDATDDLHEVYGEVLPVPDPSLSSAEMYGIDYRPRQGMFTNLQAARKIFVQSANNLLKHIPIRESNPFWLNGATTDAYQGVYWDYADWYEIGFEDSVPTLVFPTLTDAQAALTAGTLPVSTIIEVVNGTADGRFIMYKVVQTNPNVAALSFETIAIENSAVTLLNSIYTQSNVLELSFEIRSLLTAFRTEVMINNYFVDQNELYFSMLNFVVSEQKNPDWLFKSSYIYVKENNVPLDQPALYIPDQIDNILSYITDSKPYHTQVRDYTSVHTTSDIATGVPTQKFTINVSTLLPVVLEDNTLDPANPIPVPLPNGGADAQCLADINAAIAAVGTNTANRIIYGEGHWDANCDDPAIDLPWDSNTIGEIGHWDVGTISYLTVDANYQENIDSVGSITLLCNGDPTLPLTNSGDPLPNTDVWNAIDPLPDTSSGGTVPSALFGASKFGTFQFNESDEYYTRILEASFGGIWYTNLGVAPIGQVAQYLRENFKIIESL